MPRNSMGRPMRFATTQKAWPGSQSLIIRKLRRRLVRNGALCSYRDAVSTTPDTFAGARGFGFPKDDDRQLCATDCRKVFLQIPFARVN